MDGLRPESRLYSFLINSAGFRTTTYIAAYFSTSGFAYSVNQFTTSGVDSPPLHALQTGVDGANAVYAYGGTPQFPSFPNSGPNYWVDLLFTPN